MAHAPKTTSEILAQLHTLANGINEAAPTLDNLKMLALLDSTVSRLATQFITEARNNGDTFEEIGSALGITRQAAQQRASRG